MNGRRPKTPFAGRFRIGSAAAALVTLWIQGCALTYQSAHGQRHRVGLVWDTYPGANSANGHALTYRNLGAWADLTRASGGLGLGYRSATVIDMSGDACLVINPREATSESATLQ